MARQYPKLTLLQGQREGVAGSHYSDVKVLKLRIDMVQYATCKVPDLAVPTVSFGLDHAVLVLRQF